jgi:hypothetical protein
MVRRLCTKATTPSKPSPQAQDSGGASQGLKPRTLLAAGQQDADRLILGNANLENAGKWFRASAHTSYSPTGNSTASAGILHFQGLFPLGSSTLRNASPGLRRVHGEGNLLARNGLKNQMALGCCPPSKRMSADAQASVPLSAVTIILRAADPWATAMELSCAILKPWQHDILGCTGERRSGRIGVDAQGRGIQFQRVGELVRHVGTHHDFGGTSLNPKREIRSA